MIIKKTIIVLALVILVATTGLLALTYHTPLEMVFDTDNCGESPIGFYRFHVLPYEMTDYGGNGRVQAGDAIGGIWDFVKFYFGQRSGC